MDQNREKQDKLMQLVRDAMQRDEELRNKYQVGEKFRFVRDRLQALLSELNQSVIANEVEEKKVQSLIPMDATTIVYVYLFNAQGMQLRNWATMLMQPVFYEYSVNRPIYSEKKHVETLIQSKSNPLQHAYLTFAIKREQLLISPEMTVTKDILGQPVVKIKEGCLVFQQLIGFTHNKINYKVSSQGELTRKFDDLG